MRVTVHIDIESPGGPAAGDELRARGAAQLLMEALATIARVEGPGGAVVRPLGAHCLARPGGVAVHVVADAPSADIAGTGLRLAFAQLVGEHPALAGWRVARQREPS
ncbi:hypothetical protein [Marinitenerispora sediminis]|uniref:Uncharacterized protein n=1 Tax=Marinitenerispora sediminis TaxID=1931232 RepID=A0A368TBK7_9ACTN|nr:hypothetical protein [Marinitenerispora sediminis]RCV58173.1 hypothetical protein DEF28_00440 [Marinitenerispora sediminis]RCV61464.1 hypothetical protein DEF23_02255 [Marinitenerispora sediminis]RCV62544.1 hypothetical protein DEF24_00790 [Marinitenerispora sediminis]